MVGWGQVWMSARPPAVLRAAVAAAAAAIVAPQAAGLFEHGFDTVQATMWGQVGASFATQQQLEWMAANYGLVVVGPQVVVENGTEKWPPPFHRSDAPRHGLPGQFENARRLKAANRSVLVLLDNNGLTGLDGAGDEIIAQHPEWFLKDDDGQPCINPTVKTHAGGPTPWMIDYRVAAARQWWVRAATNTWGSGASPPGGQLFDGYMIDTAGAIIHVPPSCSLSAQSRRDLITAKMQMFAEAGGYLSELTGGRGGTIGNPTIQYDCIGMPAAYVDKQYPPPFSPTSHVQFLNGSYDENFGATDVLNRVRNCSWLNENCTRPGCPVCPHSHMVADGSLNVTKMNGMLEAIIKQAAAGKAVLIRGVPGPLDTFGWTVNLTAAGGWDNWPKQVTVPAWPPAFHRGRQPQSVYDLQAVSKEFLESQLALYLVVAAPTVWWAYGFWYDQQAGWAPCPDNPGGCTAPPNWYPELSRPLGEPLGPAVRNGSVWVRHFEHAIATANLADQAKSSVQWLAPHAAGSRPPAAGAALPPAPASVITLARHPVSQRWRLERGAGKALPFTIGLNHAGLLWSPCPSFDAECLRADLVNRLYHGNATEAALDAVRQLRGWGYSGASYDLPLGTAPGDAMAARMPYVALTMPLNLQDGSGPSSWQPLSKLHFPDPWAEDTRERMHTKITAKCQAVRPHRHNLIGYIWTDLPSYDIRAVKARGVNDWVSSLRCLPSPSAAGRRVYSSWLRDTICPAGAKASCVCERYGLDVALCPSWGRLELCSLNNSATPAAMADDYLFLPRIVEEIYSVANASIAACDPEALVLTDTFHGWDGALEPDSILAVAAKFAGALSLQPGGTAFSKSMYERVHSQFGRPIFMADAGMAFPLPSYSQYIWREFPSQRDAAAVYAADVVGAAESGYMIGFNKCQLIDRVVDQAHGIGPLKPGLLNFNGTPHQPLTSLVAAANREAIAANERLWASAGSA